MADPLKKGFTLPDGSDYIRNGDDAIRQNAQAAADGLEAVEKSIAAAKAGMDASHGPKVVAIDTDGTPYYAPDGDGTHRIYPDGDGTPYYALNLWPRTSTDTTGAPILTY